jgi:SAM-dependent methyltransferase
VSDGSAVSPKTGNRAHWQRVYKEREPDRLSWYEPVPERSLEMIERARLEPDAAILDIGGGASSLARELLDSGYTDITVADISGPAMDHAKARLGDASDRITWLEVDVLRHDFGRHYDLWHDRALLHFMVEPGDRDAYVKALKRALKPGGWAIIATFGPAGPTRCSGLPVDRYGAADLLRALGEGFELVSSTLDDHLTPSGITQQFLYASLRRN